MKKGLWMWQYQDGGASAAIEACKEASCDAIIGKCGYQGTYYGNVYRDLVAQGHAANLQVGAEIYSYPDTVGVDSYVLNQALIAGADFLVIDAEEEWESAPADDMIVLCAEIQRSKPIYGCTDFRGNRITLPYHIILNRYVVGWMPMIYPQAFYPDRHAGYIAEAVNDSLALYRYLTTIAPATKILAPVIQAYGGMNYAEVAQQIALSYEYGAHAFSVYVAHDFNPYARQSVHDAPTRCEYK